MGSKHSFHCNALNIIHITPSSSITYTYHRVSIILITLLEPSRETAPHTHQPEACASARVHICSGVYTSLYTFLAREGRNWCAFETNALITTTVWRAHSALGRTCWLRPIFSGPPNDMQIVHVIHAFHRMAAQRKRAREPSSDRTNFDRFQPTIVFFCVLCVSP